MLVLVSTSCLTQALQLMPSSSSAGHGLRSLAGAFLERAVSLSAFQLAALGGLEGRCGAVAHGVAGEGMGAKARYGELGQ